MPYENINSMQKGYLLSLKNRLEIIYNDLILTFKSYLLSYALKKKNH